jgi:hypothetical protein
MYRHRARGRGAVARDVSGAVSREQGGLEVEVLLLEAKEEWEVEV